MTYIFVILGEHFVHYYTIPANIISDENVYVHGNIICWQKRKSNVYRIFAETILYVTNPYAPISVLRDCIWLTAQIYCNVAVVTRADS